MMMMMMVMMMMIMLANNKDADDADNNDDWVFYLFLLHARIRFIGQLWENRNICRPADV